MLSLNKCFAMVFNQIFNSYLMRKYITYMLYYISNNLYYILHNKSIYYHI